MLQRYYRQVCDKLPVLNSLKGHLLEDLQRAKHFVVPSVGGGLAPQDSQICGGIFDKHNKLHTEFVRYTSYCSY